MNTQQLSNLIRHRYEMVFGDLYLSGSISDLAAAQRTSRLAGAPGLEAEVEKTVRRILRKEQAKFSSREESVLIRERLEFAIAVLEQLPKTKDAQVWVAFLESQQSYSDHDLLESAVELIHRQRDHFVALFAPPRPVRHDFRQ